MDQGTIEALVRLAWLAGAVGFVIGLRRMTSPATARNGNLLSAGGMALAIAATAVFVARNGASTTAWLIIAVGIAIGGGLGLYAARTVKMTAMPQLVSLFNAVGGGAAALIAIDDYIRLAGEASASPLRVSVPTVLDIVIGSITFTGSLIASSKLQGLISGKPILVPGGRFVTIALAAIAAAGSVYLFLGNVSLPVMFVILAAALVFGVTMVLPIGGADMPVVISLLNSFTGTAVAMAGFVIDNPVLIIAGALVGASGAILTNPLAEANVPYPQLKEMEEINPEFERADVALVVGANDVTNPAARRPGTPVSGMPILDVDHAKSIIVVKRSMGRGYAGIDNELYSDPKTGMLFADAKDGLASLISAVKAV